MKKIGFLFLLLSTACDSEKCLETKGSILKVSRSRYGAYNPSRGEHGTRRPQVQGSLGYKTQGPASERNK